MNKDQWRKLDDSFKGIIGGYCWSQDGGSGGYEYEDIKNFIEKHFIPKAELLEWLEGEKVPICRCMCEKNKIAMAHNQALSKFASKIKGDI